MAMGNSDAASSTPHSHSPTSANDLDSSTSSGGHNGSAEQQLQQSPTKEIRTEGPMLANGRVGSPGKLPRPGSRTSPSSSNFNQPGSAQPTFTIDYLTQLMKDKQKLTAFPNVFHHMERLVDEEINKCRVALFQFEFTKEEEMVLPEADGEVATMQEKVFVPAKEYPDYNFVGRILGPRGMTAKQLEQETGCKIMVRGRGSMRDKKKEEQNRGKPNWEHLNDELHVLIQCEDTVNRAEVKLQRAASEIKKLLVPAPEGEDELKRKQLMELAIINGTYRPASQQNKLAAMPGAARLFTPMTLASPSIRSPSALAGGPIILSPGRATQFTAAGIPMTPCSTQSLAGLSSPYTPANTINSPMVQQSPMAGIDAAYQHLLVGNQLVDPQTALLQSCYGGAVNLANPTYANAAATLLNQANPFLADFGGIAAAHQQQQQALGDFNNAAATGAILSTQRRILGQARHNPYDRKAMGN